MSRHAKRPKAKIKLPSLQARDTAELVSEATDALNGARHKEAAELYKELVKRERRSEWLDSLALCYVGRANSLAAKGMFKEALVLWRNRTEVCGKPLVEGPYIGWLAAAGEQNELFRLLSAGNLPAEMMNELAMHLAGAVLVAPESDLTSIPPTSFLLQHRVLILAAWAAYQRGDFAAMEEQLQAIPFRSPYRDLKLALKALVLLETHSEQAQSAIARLPAGGPFERVVAVARAAALPESRWIGAMYDLDDESRQWVLDIKGCPDALRPLLLELFKLGRSPAAVSLFDLLLRHRRVLTDPIAAQFCQRVLPHAPARLNIYNKALGKLPEEKQTHIQALAAELQRDYRTARQHWGRMAKKLSAVPNHKRSAALIWRHIIGEEDSGAPDDIVIDSLSKSLELDPHHLNSQLRLIRLFRARGDLQNARVYLDKALPHFPKESSLLLEGVEVALAGNTFKKAVSLAKQVLALDPINPQVRVVIGHAHFWHARKKLKVRNYKAAIKELAAAAEWLSAPTDRATLKLLSAMAMENEAGLGDASLRDAIADLGGGLVGGFQLLLEVDRVGYQRDIWLKRSGIDLNAVLTPDKIVSLARTLLSAEDAVDIQGDALRPFRAALKRAAQSPFSEADLRLVCEAFLRIREAELLSIYAESALKQWPRNPAFVYFKMYAHHYEAPFLISNREMDSLERAANEARNQNDLRTAQRIRDFMSPPMSGMPFGGDDYDDDDDLDEFSNDPQGLLEMLMDSGSEDELLDRLRKTVGEPFFIELKKIARGSKKRLVEMLIEFMEELNSPTSALKPSPRSKQRDLFDD